MSVTACRQQYNGQTGTLSLLQALLRRIGAVADDNSNSTKPARSAYETMNEEKMVLQKRLNPLSSLREEIAILCVVKCRMSHERVIRDQASGLSITCRFPEGSYQRVGLCAPDLRATRLGCSHTTARIKLDDAIKLLETSKVRDKVAVSSLSRELGWLDNAIHLLDHRKGEAEKKLARIRDEVCGAVESEEKWEKVREAEKEIGEMEQIHDEYVERLGQLRDKIVSEIDKLSFEDTLRKETWKSEAA